MTWSDADRELFDVVDRQVAGNPRSAQRAVGPSGLGDPCDRGLLTALAGVRPDRRPYEMWKAAVGTASHAYLAEAMEADNRRRGVKRWVVEQKVECGTYAGRTVKGTADLYDVEQRVVYDWKSTSQTRLKAYRANGPGERYRVQAHLYGAGYAALGLIPREVALVFVPRDGELTSAHVWREAWDPAVPAAALDRAGRLQALLDRVGLDAACDGLEPCSSIYCDGCPTVPRSIFG